VAAAAVDVVGGNLSHRLAWILSAVVSSRPVVSGESARQNNRSIVAESLVYPINDGT
jgi:hypothetical protein